MSTRINNNLPSFAKNLNVNLDAAFREATRNILINAKIRAPFDKGGLRADTDGKKVGGNKWRVSFWKEYARFQEFGGDAMRKIRKYSTAGTGSKFLSRAGNDQAKNMRQTLLKHARSTRP